MNLILLGAPGAGKGTLAASLIEKMGIPSVSTGNLLREAIANGTELGLKAKQFMDAGELVPDQLVIDMLRDRIAQADCAKGYILDGFPRTIPQAEALDTIAEIECALSLEVPDEVIEPRMTGRRTCIKCGATYHVMHNPPKAEGICDNCGSELTIRKDDKPETVRARLATFHAQTEPLKEFYGAQGKLKCVDGTQSIEATLEAVCKELGL
jgi:adenylate kinase